MNIVKKRILTLVLCLLAVGVMATLVLKIFILPVINFIDDLSPPSKEEIISYVRVNSELITDVVDEIVNLEKEHNTSGFWHDISTIGHSKINTYVDEVKGLYIYVNNEYKEIDNKLLESVLNKKPVHNIWLEDGAIYFYCGGSGFGSATNYYGFYYSFSGDPQYLFHNYPDRDDRYYTQIILDNFFYYEEHY